MSKTPAYAAPSSGAPLASSSIERREPRSNDVAVDILYCGVCHTDIHQVRDEWGDGLFPMVPGHEIVGRVARVGAGVRGFKTGDIVGVGCMVDSCRQCDPCHRHMEQFCARGCAYTYNSTEMDRRTPTYGGYSAHIVVDESFVLRVPAGLDPAAAAPLLCAGITTYSPLRQWNCKQGARVGVVGLGGLGHMAVKLAASMGAEVAVLSSSPAKEADARRLGADDFILTREAAALKKWMGSLDLILDTVSAPHDYNRMLSLLAPLGTMVLVGIPPEPTPLVPYSLIQKNRRLVGSLIGGIRETQEMLDYCGEHGITADIELIPVQEINRAYERMMRSDVRYRFVIDAASLNS